MEWISEAPRIDDQVVKDCVHPELYYWVRGCNLNRPCIMRCNKGVTGNKHVDPFQRTYWPQLNFQLWVEGYECWPVLWYEQLVESVWLFVSGLMCYVSTFDW